MSSRKRKYTGQHKARNWGDTHDRGFSGHEHDESDKDGGWEEQHWQRPSNIELSSAHLSLRVTAHEAEIIRGPQAEESAHALELGKDGVGGKGLMKLSWTGASGEDVWVDRYDARLLLDGPLTIDDNDITPSESGPASPTGWSDLPSDAEDTFFLAPEDIEDYERTKRRRAIERLREERMRAMEDDDDGAADEGEQWGGSDEEPDEEQKAVMLRTAKHLLSSPNAAQLEMRILVNHGSNARFAFLRGRWPRAWATVKAQVRLEKDGGGKQKMEKEGAKLSGLIAYTDSDSDEFRSEDNGTGDEDDVKEHPASLHTKVDGTTGQSSSSVGDEAAKEARRARAREWAEKRRMEKLQARVESANQSDSS